MDQMVQIAKERAARHGVPKEHYDHLTCMVEINDVVNAWIIKKKQEERERRKLLRGEHLMRKKKQ